MFTSSPTALKLGLDQVRIFNTVITAYKSTIIASRYEQLHVYILLMCRSSGSFQTK